MISAAFRGGPPRSLARAAISRLFTLTWAAALSCASAPHATPSPEPNVPPPMPDVARDTPSFAVVELPKLPGAIALDDAGRWREANGGSFTVLEHAASRSRLSVRVSRAARLVRPDECETEARLVRPSLPRIDPEAVIDSRPLSAPEGFNGSVSVGVDLAPSGSTHGIVLAVGAAVGRCFVLAFETSADGANSAQIVGDRLRAATDHIVPSVELRSIDERVRPERDL